MEHLQRKVIIVGTCHRFQRGTTIQGEAVKGRDLDAFRDLLRVVIKTKRPNGLAEEMCQPENGGPDRTTVEEVALEAELLSRRCNPGSDELKAMGHEPQKAMFVCIKLMFFEEEDTEEARLKWGSKWEAIDFEVRELSWIARLSAFDKWPVLFICGHSHVASFQERLTSLGFATDIAIGKWPSDME
jgi:hypothetical protein